MMVNQSSSVLISGALALVPGWDALIFYPYRATKNFPPTKTKRLQYTLAKKDLDRTFAWKPPFLVIRSVLPLKVHGQVGNITPEAPAMRRFAPAVRVRQSFLQTWKIFAASPAWPHHLRQYEVYVVYHGPTCSRPAEHNTLWLKRRPTAAAHKGRPPVLGPEHFSLVPEWAEQIQAWAAKVSNGRTPDVETWKCYDLIQANVTTRRW